MLGSRSTLGVSLQLVPKGAKFELSPPLAHAPQRLPPCPLCLSCTNLVGLTADPIPLPILAAPVDDLWPNAPHSGSHDSCRCGGDPGPITPQLVTLISEEASCRVTEQGLGRERMDEEKRRRWKKGREGSSTVMHGNSCGGQDQT